MKKIIPVLAVLGSAVAFAVYKMKKDEKKQLGHNEDDFLYEENPTFHKEIPVTEPEHVCPSEEEKADTDAKVDELLDKIARENEKEEVLEEPVEEEIEDEEELPVEEVEEETNEQDLDQPSDEYPHLTNRMVEDIQAMTRNAIASLAADGDVHTNERPVQHMVSFTNQEDLDGFKSKVINKGFVITKGENEFDLVVLHISAIVEEKLVSSILYLADQTYAFHGEYRGWQSKVSF